MGYKIKEAREKKGMTQKDLVEKSGVSRSTISKIENNPEQVVRTETILKIAKALNRSVGDIFFK